MSPLPTVVHTTSALVYIPAPVIVISVECPMLLQPGPLQSCIAYARILSWYLSRPPVTIVLEHRFYNRSKAFLQLLWRSPLVMHPAMPCVCMGWVSVLL